MLTPPSPPSRVLRQPPFPLPKKSTLRTPHRPGRVTHDPFLPLSHPVLPPPRLHHPPAHRLPPDPRDTQRSTWLRKRLLVRGMAWFWELHRALRDMTLAEDEELDCRRLWLYLATHTFPRYGMRGPFMSVANRRRI